MKKVVYFIIFTLAVMLLSSFKAKDVLPAPSLKLKQQAAALHISPTGSDSMLFLELLENEPDENDTDSGKKKLPAGKSTHSIGSVLAGNLSHSHFKKFGSGLSFLQSCASLCILFSVFRL